MRIIEEGIPAVDHEAKAALFDSFALVAGALAAGRRGEIVEVLAQGERSVEEVANELDQSIANASHHLRRLAQAGLVCSRRDGTRIYYRLANEHVETLWAALQRVTETVRPDLGALSRAYLGAEDDLELLGREELLERLARGDITVVDVRPHAEFKSGHIPGARSIPLAELALRIGELPRDLPVVVYCRGRYCAFAPEAVRALRGAGMTASRLEEGFPQWRKSGLPIETGEDAHVADSA